MNRRRFITGVSTAVIGTGILGSVDPASAHGFPMVHTRDHFDSDGNRLEGTWEYETNDDIFGADADHDMTIMVHGWNNDHGDAWDKTNNAHHELIGAGYDGTVLGYSWDSDKGGWGDAKEIAHKNGYKLANLCQDLKYYNDCDVRIVTHSLGVQVALWALMVLNGWSGWEDYGWRLDSVHFLGAAQDNECVTQEWDGERFEGIHQETVATFNYWNHDDNVLSWYYNTYEFDQALGESGAEDGNEVPHNYHDYEVTEQVGDDHGGYLDALGPEIVYHMEHNTAYNYHY